MDNIKSIITGGILTLVVGGTVFTFSQEDVVNNFADETGLSQEQAEQYINDIPDEELVSWDEVGITYIEESKTTQAYASEIDCEIYEYEWETPTLSCSEGKSQLQQIANSEGKLGRAYLNLSNDNATEDDMRAVILLLDRMNSDYQLEISRQIFEMEEILLTNTYNKSVLKAALESE